MLVLVGLRSVSGLSRFSHTEAQATHSSHTTGPNSSALRRASAAATAIQTRQRRLARKYPLAEESLANMADPFEVRMRFSSQLQHLNASVASAQKAAQYALKYKDMDEDLHSCILEQVERVSERTDYAVCDGRLEADAVAE